MQQQPFFLAILTCMILTLSLRAEQPVLVDEFTVDTSLYANDDPTGLFYNPCPGPYLFMNGPNSLISPNMMLKILRKKNSNEVDIYSYAGKIGTSVVPVFVPSIDEYPTVRMSCFFIDSDSRWESIVRYSDGTTDRFKVFDDDGTELLAGEGADVGYGFDGINTYVTVLVNRIPFSMKTWRFRTDFASSGSPQMAKKAYSVPLMQIYGLSNDAYRVTLTPESGNRLHFQIFDLLGRCTYSRTIGNISEPASFILSKEEVPETPFIAKTSNGKSATAKKVIPVR